MHNKGDLAVLHNRNKMVNTFTNTEWVSGSRGAIISRSVTSCAGMTAFLVLLAQTRVGFLSGGRGKSFPSTPSTRTSFPKRRGLCEGYSCFHPSATDLLHHGPIGHARSSWSRDYYRLLENMVPVSVGLMNRRTLYSSSVLRMMISWSHLMTRPFCKACGSPAQELMEFIRLLLW